MTTPTANNRPPIFSLSVGSQGHSAPSVPTPSDPAESFQRGLGARLREMGLGVQTEPLREMRLQMGLDMQVVYVTVRVPVAGGVTLRLPVMATFKPRIYSPTQAQHLSS
ncbi:MAG TPA: hypothetical protein VFW69_02340 [Mycobacterium sp.]|nr:hypothetical protein [Mycobacterium sp.]